MVVRTQNRICRRNLSTNRLYLDVKTGPKEEGTSEIMASGYRVFFSGDCSGTKGRKGQHGVGLAIKVEIVKKAGKDGNANEVTSPRLLKARISIKSIFVAFAVAYAPTEEAPEGQKPNTWQPSTAPWHQCSFGNTSSF